MHGVSPRAQIGARVTIGPFAVIEDGAQIGDDCRIEAHAVIRSGVILGCENIIGHGAILGGDPQDLTFRPETRTGVRLGERNRIRELCTIHRSTQEGMDTRLGDDCFLMAGAHLGHDAHLGDGVILANGVLLGGHVEVGDRAFLGGGCVFHQRVRVGRLAICQGASAFSKDIPPFTMAAERNAVAGLNVVGLRRAGFSASERAEIKAAFQLVYRRGWNVAQALAAARERPWSDAAREFFLFISEAKKHGVCALLRQSGRAGEARGEEASGLGL